MQNSQQTLSQNQIEAFYHDNFVESQVRDFIKLLGPAVDPSSGCVVDIGGGCGYFAKALLATTPFKVRVLDTDMQSVTHCQGEGLDAAHGDALNPTIAGDEGVICFNLILHHLVGKSEAETSDLQRRALSAWHSKAPAIFVNEYIYESYGAAGFSGWLIYQITSNSALSKLGNLIAKILPSLKANTFGVGVRFRSHQEWKRMFESLGFNVVATVTGKQEGVSLPRRMLLIKNCRRDSFLLKPKFAQVGTIREGEQ